MSVVDMHTHFLPKTWPDLAEKFGGEWPWMRHTEPGKAMLMQGDKDYRPVYEACWNPAVRIEEMDRDGIDTQIMCATPLLFSYDKKSDQAHECAKIFNDLALDICSHDNNRLKA
ncbi:MAG: amidohydrolase, partial [Moritella sp.]|nr:amidohydrolase [Moritella sp.]